MTFKLTKTFPRLWSLESGMVMVVTDLHGDWEAYQRYRDHYIDLQANRQADGLIFTGDLIHSEDAAKPDQSLEIVLDIMDLQAVYGEAIVYLIGNHELPHIYGIKLSKNEKDYTPAFEAALMRSRRRAEVLAFFDSLPFYLRTKAGVSVTHAGAAAPPANPKCAHDIFNWNHQSLLSWADEALQQGDLAFLRRSYASRYHLPYETLANYYLAVSGPDDPRYNDLLRGFVARSHATFDQLLWPALFSRCEEDYGNTNYATILQKMLQELSIDFYPQQVLIAGHMTIRGGHKIIAKRHLRLASAYHATPREAGEYLLFDAAKPINGLEDLLTGLGSVYDARLR